MHCGILYFGMHQLALFRSTFYNKGAYHTENAHFKIVVIHTIMEQAQSIDA